MKALCLLVLAGCAASAQIQFNTVDGTTEAPIPNNVYNLAGPFAVGVNQSIRIRVRNRAPQQVCVVRNPASLGTGFSLDLDGNPALPAILAAGDALDFRVNFLPPSVARSASANFEIQYAFLASGASCSGPNTPTNIVRADLIIQANNITAAAVASLTPGGAAITQIVFPTTSMGQKSSVRFYLSNPGTTTLTIPGPIATPLDTKGAFTIVNQPAFPLTLNPTEFAPVDLQFSPALVAPYVGVFLLGSMSVTLTGSGAAPPFSTPVLSVSPTLVSGTQAQLSIKLDTPAPAEATGTLTLAFQPTAGGMDDAAIKFLIPSSRRVSFTFKAGDTVATIGTANFATFQTGTTAGVLTFTADLLAKSVQAKATMAPQAIAIDSTIANRPNDSQLTIQLTGFDNSKSASQLAFTFYDTAGVAVPPGRITYDATLGFQQFFTQSTTGSMFSLLAQFPVKGSTANIATADVELTNAVGTTNLAKLRFSPCTVVLTAPCTTGFGCPCQ